MKTFESPIHALILVHPLILVSSNIVKFSLVNLPETYPNVKFRAFNKTISMSHYIPARDLVQ